MTEAYFTQNQFQIAVGMSEAVFKDFQYDGENLVIEVYGVNILYDFLKLTIVDPNISYDKWLELKYTRMREDNTKFQHVYIDDLVKFVINEPKIIYEGDQDQFLDEFYGYDFHDIENPKNIYIFGGSYHYSSHDEFEVHSNSPIKIIGLDAVHGAAEQHLNGESKIQRFNETLNKVKEKKRKKDKLKKRNKKLDNYFMSF
jgi:hypothetical protein